MPISGQKRVPMNPHHGVAATHSVDRGVREQAVQQHRRLALARLAMDDGSAVAAIEAVAGEVRHVQGYM